MIYFTTEDNGFIKTMHNFPSMLNKSDEELMTTGYLVEDVPEAPEKEGYSSKTKYVDGEFEFVYEELPPVELTEKEQLEELRNTIADLTELFMMGGM